jgi:MOSC domain-containing protein
MMHVGHVCEITRYPVKSMAGVPAESARLGWHGLEGDRRFAFRRIQDDSGFPWLTASRLPELLLYQPISFDESRGEPVPTQVRTPTGSQLKLPSAELNSEISRRFGSPVELMNLKHGIFDQATMSVITTTTIAAIGRESEIGTDLDRRRFRMNVVLEGDGHEPFCEDEWLGGTLVFGDSDAAPAVRVTLRDERCVMINLNPETAATDARLMKTVVRLNQNNAGVYATVLRLGLIRVGDPVRLFRPTLDNEP